QHTHLHLCRLLSANAIGLISNFQSMYTGEKGNGLYLSKKLSYDERYIIHFTRKDRDQNEWVSKRCAASTERNKPDILYSDYFFAERTESFRRLRVPCFPGD